MRMRSFAALLATVSVPALAEPAVLTKVNTSPPDATAHYWTPERMATARPYTELFASSPEAMAAAAPAAAVGRRSFEGAGGMPDPSVRPAPQKLFDLADLPSFEDLLVTEPLLFGTSGQRFSTSRVPNGQEKTYPYRTVGRLYFTIPGQGNFVCSGAVLRPRILLTAGHCVHRGTGGNSGFYTNFRFVPALEGNTAPYQTWDWAYLVAPTAWTQGGGSFPNAQDIAIFELVDRNINGIKKIGTVVGWLGYKTLALRGNHVAQVGYPVNLDSGVSQIITHTTVSKNANPNCGEAGTNQKGGTSGGPWVQNWGETPTGQTYGSGDLVNQVVGVSSYTYTNAAWNSDGSSVLDTRFISALNTACGHRSGNC